MIILIGRAGTGKSTQGKRLAKDLNCEWVSVGGILRNKMTGEYAERMLAGEVLDDDKVLPLLDEELERIDAAKNEFILDGSPRTMVQAEWWIKKIKEGKVKLTAVIHLDASEEVVRQRLLARGRPDDHEAAINERFKEYQKVILPILEYLEKEKMPVFHVDAEKSPEEVEIDIENIIKNLDK